MARIIFNILLWGGIALLIFMCFTEWEVNWLGIMLTIIFIVPIWTALIRTSNLLYTIPRIINSKNPRETENYWNRKFNDKNDGYLWENYK